MKKVVENGEIWKRVDGFPDYSISNHGNVRSDRYGRFLSHSINQFDAVFVSMMREGHQRHRSISRLVANAFIPRPSEPFDTPINLDGNKFNNHVDNLMWRPRWFAIKYHRQFREPYPYPINVPIVDIISGETSQGTFDAAIKYGLLEQELVLSILNEVDVWPTHQQFMVIDDQR